MNLEDVTKFIDKKIEDNENKIVVKYYEMKVKRNLTDEQLSSISNLISIRLINLKYKVYTTGQEYIQSGRKNVVQTNELIVAIK